LHGSSFRGTEFQRITGESRVVAKCGFDGLRQRYRFPGLRRRRQGINEKQKETYPQKNGTNRPDGA